ncbi:MAG: hypothetical protein RR540_01315 [Oscillospiraceae bacterium]
MIKMSATEVEKCQYCGSNELGVGYQLGQGEMLSDYYGKSGCKIIHVICKKCGSILQSKVSNPEIFDDENKL